MLFETLTDEQIERLLDEFLSDAALADYIGESVAFDWHSKVILKALRHTNITRVLTTLGPSARAIRCASDAIWRLKRIHRCIGHMVSWLASVKHFCQYRHAHHKRVLRLPVERKPVILDLYGKVAAALHRVT